MDTDNNTQLAAAKREEARALVPVLSKRRSKVNDDGVVVRGDPEAGYDEYYLVSPTI